MVEKKWINRVFAAIDRKDTDTFVSFLAPSCIFRFGNMPPVQGKEEIESSVRTFFESLTALSHTLIDAWDVSDGSVCHGQVVYTRKDGSVLSVPFANVMKGREASITEYLIFADTSKLYE